MKQTQFIGGGSQRYSAPKMESITIEIERGFAQSGGAGGEFPDTGGGNNGSPYSLRDEESY